MFDKDKWMEIFHTILNNPLRTILTGTSVALGIFILVVMQGLGFGLQNGVFKQIQDDAINSIWVRSGRTSIGYRGLNPNRTIQYENRDLQWTLDEIEGVGDYSARVGIWNASMVYGSKSMNFSVRGVHSGHQTLERTELLAGRFINEADVSQERKVCVVGGTIREDLFEGDDPIGKYLMIQGVQFRVVGYYNDPNSRWENRLAYVPVTTAQSLFGWNERIDMFMISTKDASLEKTQLMAAQIEQHLKEVNTVHPEDDRAIRIRNNNEEFKEFMDIFFGIRLFIWAIGSFTLLAGVIGVANIMSIVVKERTKEIGVRKALGATPATIISLIIQESVFLTFTAGCIGLLLGVLLLEATSGLIEHDFFSNPKVDFQVCVIAMVILTVAGALSGLFPALRAVSIRPVEALRDE
jgi:putative ABC transport system permease protein